MSCDFWCYVALPHGVVGWSVACDCGIPDHNHFLPDHNHFLPDHNHFLPDHNHFLPDHNHFLLDHNHFLLTCFILVHIFN